MDEAKAGEYTGGTIINTARGLLGAVLGGAAGYFATGWLARQGFYAMALPGASIGLGAGLLVTKRCPGVAIVCGILALALGVFTEWSNFPFVRNARLGSDPSLGYFLRHLGNLRPLTLILIGLGTVAGYWFALGVGGKRSAPPIRPRDC
jgi:hypothetical protein